MTRSLAPAAAVVLAALVALPPAHAAPAKKSALEAARSELDEAAFERAVAIADAALEGTVTDAERGALQLLRAEAFSALQQAGPMKEALEAALLADPTVSFDEANTKPELVEALAAVRRKYAGKVSVGPPPQGTPAPEVLLDGESLGRAPVEATTAVGRHQVSLVWSATARTDAAVVVRTDAVTPVEVQPVAELSAPAAAPAAEVRSPAPAGFRWPVVPLAAGGAVAATGAVFLIVSGANYGALTGGDGTSSLNLTRAEAQRFADENQAVQVAGIALVSVGAAAAIFGAVFLAAGVDQPKVAVGVTPDGAALVLSGVLP